MLMANYESNIQKILIDGDVLMDLMDDAGYSIRRMSEKIGCSDRSLRAYLKNGIIPTVIFEKIKDVISPSTAASKAATDDKVNHPNHYTFGSIEVIDYIRDKMTPDEFQGYCMGNILKYVSRHKHKNGVEDLKKAQVYLGWLIESEEKVK